jgi:hypothetical protein
MYTRRAQKKAVFVKCDIEKPKETEVALYGIIEKKCLFFSCNKLSIC